MKTTILINVLGALIVLLIFAVIVGIRLLIAGPDCFFATDVGVCQAILRTGGTS